MVELACPDRRDDVSVADPAVRGHRKIESGGDGCDPIRHGAPVADNGAVETPLIAKGRGEEPVVLGGMSAVDSVV